jgi:DNA processing protein
MTENQLANQRNWLIAIRSPGLAGRKLIDAVERAGGISGLIAANSRLQRQIGLAQETTLALSRPDEDLLQKDIAWLRGDNRHLLTWDSDSYPALLRRIPSPPAALFIEGDPAILWQPQIAIIGSRNPTVGGLEHGRAFSAEFCRRGMTVTSGLASGIDSAAHDAALKAGGKTIAVTGTGLDTVYPASSRKLAARIARAGTMVSEYPVGTPPRRGHFPSRNRIISGLSLGVLVVEAGLNSGTLITARQAGEQGRDVCALPGSLHNPMIKGCHRLIREGARLVETVEDVMAELAPLALALADELQSQIKDRPGGGDQSEKPDPDDGLAELLADPDYQKLWAALEYDPLGVDDLVRLSGLPVPSMSSMLLMLELRGLVEAHTSGRYSRTRPESAGSG